MGGSPSWLKDDSGARADLLFEVQRGINAALGRNAPNPIDAAAVEGLRAASQAWIGGVPLNAIERLLDGDPDGKRAGAAPLPRAREFVGTVVPRSLSFVVGVVARLVEELALPEQQSGLAEPLLPSLAACMRRGFSNPALHDFTNSNRNLIGRVEVHRAYADMVRSAFDDLGDL